MPGVSGVARSPSWLLAAILLLGLATGLPGCSNGPKHDGPTAYRVEGEVLYNDEPLEGAIVLFNNQSQNRSAIGRTDSNGRFTLMTYEPNDGAVEGPSVVTIKKGFLELPGTELTGFQTSKELQDAIDELSPEERGKLNMLSLVQVSEIPENYGDAAKSKLTANVTTDPQQNHFRFELTGTPSGNRPKNPFGAAEEKARARAKKQ